EHAGSPGTSVHPDAIAERLPRGDTMINRSWALLALLLLPLRAEAQSEAALKDYFEGKSVTLKLAMPGTESGVDIYPADPKPLDYPRYADLRVTERPSK